MDCGIKQFNVYRDVWKQWWLAVGLTHVDWQGWVAVVGCRCCVGGR